MKKLMIIMIAVLAIYSQASAQQPALVTSDKTGWHKIGERTVDFKSDRDEIVVMGADRFASIKFKVTGAAIDLQDLEVYYESGEKQDVPVRASISSGSESRQIDLNGGERALKKIVFVYKTPANQRGEKAQVEVWGFKTNTDKKNVNDDQAVVGRPAIITSDKTGWQKIGERTVDFKTDRDEYVVMGADRFASLKFRVTGATVDMQDLEVYYESGDKQDIPVRSVLSSGSESRVIDLNGGERALKKIVFIYKTTPNQREEKAQVEIWGRKTNADKEGGSGQSVDQKPAVITSDKTGWQKIGERTVDFNKDRDEIVVTGSDRFASLRFRVTDAAIDLQDIEVYYENGDKQDIQVRTPIHSGTDSRVIELNGGERALKKIVFVYKTVPTQRAEKAHVEVWGLKTNAVRK